MSHTPSENNTIDPRLLELGASPKPDAPQSEGDTRDSSGLTSTGDFDFTAALEPVDPSLPDIDAFLARYDLDQEG